MRKRYIKITKKITSYLLSMSVVVSTVLSPQSGEIFAQNSGLLAQSTQFMDGNSEANLDKLEQREDLDIESTEVIGNNEDIADNEQETSSDNIEKETIKNQDEEETTSQSEVESDIQQETFLEEEDTLDVIIKEETTTNSSDVNEDNNDDFADEDNFVDEAVSDINNIQAYRAGTLTKEKVNGKFVFNIANETDLLALQEVSKTDCLEDCMFQFTSSVSGSNWDLTSSTFTGISPNEAYPFKGSIKQYIKNITITEKVPLFVYLSTDATVSDMSFVGNGSSTCTAPLAKYLIKTETGRAELDITNVSVYGTYGVGTSTIASGGIFACIINKSSTPLVFNMNAKKDDTPTVGFYKKDSINVKVYNGVNAGAIAGLIQGNVTLNVNDMEIANIQVNGRDGVGSVGLIAGRAESLTVGGVTYRPTVNVNAKNVKYKIIETMTGSLVGGLFGAIVDADLIFADDCKIELATDKNKYIGNQRAKYAGGVVGFIKDSRFVIKNITAKSFYISSVVTTSGSPVDYGAGIIACVSDCNNSEISNILLDSTSADGAFSAMGSGFAGVVGELSGSNITIDNINITGCAWIGGIDNNNGLANGGIVGKVSGQNIVISNILYHMNYNDGQGSMRGYTKGGIIGEIYTRTDKESNDIYNSIKIENITLTGKNGAYGGGWPKLLGTTGIVIGKVSKKSQVCLAGDIDLSHIRYIANQNNYSTSISSRKAGKIVGTQDNALIYKESDCVIHEPNNATVKNEDTGSYDDVGDFGGVYVNRDVAGGKLITFGTTNETIVNCIRGQVSKVGSEYVLKDEADFIRLSIAMSCNNNFGITNFDDATNVESLLASNYKVTASKIDLRNTGVYSLMKSSASGTQTQKGAFTGNFTGVDGKTNIILENVSSAQWNLGLFNTIKDSTISNISVVTGDDTNDFGYRGARNFGAIAAYAYGNVILNNITASVVCSTYKLSDANAKYYGGLIGGVEAGTSKITIENVNAKPEFTEIRAGRYLGGLIGYVKFNAVDKWSNREYDITVKNVISGAIFRSFSDTYKPTASTLEVMTGGLISVIDTADTTDKTYVKMAIENYTVDGFSVDVSNATFSNDTEKSNANSGHVGGYLGYRWKNIDVEIAKNAVDTSLSNTNKNSMSVKNCEYISRGEQAAGIYYVSGRIALTDGVVGGERTADGSVSYAGSSIVVKSLDNHKYSSLYIGDATKLYTLIDNYDVHKENVSYTNGKYYMDDIVGYNLGDHMGNRGGIVNIKDAGFKDGSSDGYVSKICPDESNDKVRYYYNVFEFDDAYTEGLLNNNIDSPEKLMIYHLYRYSSSSIKRFINRYITHHSSSYEIIGEINLTGYSYYPTDAESEHVKGSGATIIFTTDARLTTLNNIVSNEAGRHYKMYGGMYVYHANYSGNMYVRNISFKGPLAGGNNTYSGFVFADTVYNTLELTNITFDGAYRYGYTNVHDAGLMLSHVGEYVEKIKNLDGTTTDVIHPTELTITGIKTINYTDLQRTDKIASTLIGSVGDGEDSSTKIVFRDMQIDFLKSVSTNNINNNISPFRYSTFIGSFKHTNKSDIYSGYGIYYFSSENYRDKIVTLGEELKLGVGFEADDNHGKLSKLTSDVADITAHPEAYLPYVCADNTIYVNPKSEDIVKGCGTYEDPYQLETTEQIYSLYMYLTGNKSYDNILKANKWKINGCGVQTGETLCNGTHTEYDYSNAATLEAFPTREQLSKAYYIIKNNIDMTEVSDVNSKNLSYEFAGFGTIDIPFAGVIVGANKSVTVTLPGSKESTTGYSSKDSYGFIKHAKGAVVKNLTLNVGDNAYVSGYSSVVIAIVDGGDNIIDNVKITGTLHTTEDNYIGGYVGEIVKGGLIIRDAVVADLDEFVVENNSSIDGSGNPSINRNVRKLDNYISGKVLDGYLVYEKVNETEPHNSTTGVIKKENFGVFSHDYNLCQDFELINIDYLKQKDVGKTTYKIKTSVDIVNHNVDMILSNGKMFEILALALNSDSLSICGEDETTNGYNLRAVNRKAYYNAIGTKDLGSAGSRTDLYNAKMYDNGHYEYPYLIDTFFENTGISDKVIFLNSFTQEYISGEKTYRVSRVNKTGKIFGIETALVPDYTCEYLCEPSSILDVTEFGYGFRGIGALYDQTYSRFNGKFNGNYLKDGTPDMNQNAVIKVNMTNTYDIAGVNYVGVFNELDTVLFTTNPTDAYILSENPLYIKNIVIEGDFENESKYLSDYAHFFTETARVGGVASGVRGNYCFKDITIRNTEITGYTDVGGIVGRVLNDGNEQLYSVLFENCYVKYGGVKDTVLTSKGFREATGTNDVDAIKFGFGVGGIVGKIGLSEAPGKTDASNPDNLYQGTVIVKNCGIDGSKSDDAEYKGVTIKSLSADAGGAIGSVACTNATMIQVMGEKESENYLSEFKNFKMVHSCVGYYNRSAGGVVGGYNPSKLGQAATAGNVLYVDTVKVDKLDITASNMSGNKKQAEANGYYGLGGILGKADCYDSNLSKANNSTVALIKTSVSNTSITDNSVATEHTQNSTVGLTVGGVGSQNFDNDSDIHSAFTNIYVIGNKVYDSTVSCNPTQTVGGVAGYLQSSPNRPTDANLAELMGIHVSKNTITGCTVKTQIASTVGGIVGFIGNKSGISCFDNNLVDSCLLYSHTTISGDAKNYRSHSTGGILGRIYIGNSSDTDKTYSVTSYNDRVINSKLAAFHTGAFVGEINTVPIIVKVNTFTATGNTIIGKAVGGFVGRGMSTGMKYYNDITITGNKILGVSTNDSVEAVAGGLVGKTENNDNTNNKAYYSNIKIAGNIIAVTARSDSSGNALAKNYAGGLVGYVEGGWSATSGLDLDDNTIGFCEKIKSVNTSSTPANDVFKQGESVTADDIKNRNSYTKRFEVINMNESIANQTEIYKYGFKIGNVFGGLKSGIYALVIGYTCDYSFGFDKSRPVVDYGLLDGMTNAEAYKDTTVTYEPYAIIRNTKIFALNAYTLFVHTRNTVGEDITDPAMIPNKLSELTGDTTTFGNLTHYHKKYNDEVLEKEKNRTLTFKDVYDSYRLNVRYSGIINSDYATINTILNQTLKPINEANSDMSLTMPIVIADGQYANAYDIINATIDGMTNVGGTKNKGDTFNEVAVSVTKVMVTEDGAGDANIKIIEGTPAITGNMKDFSYNGYDRFGVDANGKQYCTMSIVSIRYTWLNNEYNVTTPQTTTVADSYGISNVSKPVVSTKIIRIPVFVKERLDVDISFKLKEGAVYDEKDIWTNGYTGSVIMAKDTTYSLLSRFTYGSAVNNENYGNVSVNKKLKLYDNIGSFKFEVGTKLTLIETLTGHAYYYEITPSNVDATLAGIDYTSFVDSDGNHYVNKNMKWFNDHGFVSQNDTPDDYSDDYVIDAQLFIVELPSDTEDNAWYKIEVSREGTEKTSQMVISDCTMVEVTAIPGLKILFDNKKYSDEEVENDSVTYIKGELTNTRRDSVTVNARTAIVAKDSAYWDYVNNGGAQVIDSSNNGKYIEVAMYLQEQETSKRISLPIGTKVKVYDAECPAGREVVLSYGQSVLYYYKNSSRTYALDNITQNTYKDHKIVVDFSSSELKDFESSSYEIALELIRTSVPDYPMSSDMQDDYKRPISAAVSKELAVATTVKNISELAINTYEQSTDIYDISFREKEDFSQVVDLSAAEVVESAATTFANKQYFVTYKLYKKVYNELSGTTSYERINNNSIKLYHSDGGGNKQSEYSVNESAGTFEYKEALDVTKEDIITGTNGEVAGLIYRDLIVQVDTDDSGIPIDYTNYKVEMTLSVYDEGADLTDPLIVPKTLTDYFVFTVAKLKTDM